MCVCTAPRLTRLTIFCIFCPSLLFFILFLIFRTILLFLLSVINFLFYLFYINKFLISCKYSYSSKKDYAFTHSLFAYFIYIFITFFCLIKLASKIFFINNLLAFTHTLFKYFINFSLIKVDFLIS